MRVYKLEFGIQNFINNKSKFKFEKTVGSCDCKIYSFWYLYLTILGSYCYNYEKNKKEG